MVEKVTQLIPDIDLPLAASHNHIKGLSQTEENANISRECFLSTC